MFHENEKICDGWRSYINAASGDPKLAQAPIGLGDLWGMPPVRGQPIKLGCGSLTAPSGKRDVPCNSGDVAEKIIRNYAEKFPMFRDCTAASVEIRQWVAINLPFPFLESGKCVVVTSDNGAGFKFAPYVASKICSHFEIENQIADGLDSFT